MDHLLTHTKTLCTGLLLVFLFSGNVLLYSTHLVAEIGHQHQVKAVYYATDDLASNCSDDGGCDVPDGHQHHHEHDKKNSCCESHSHLSIAHVMATTRFLPQVTQHPAVERACFIPEVYLDKFIPPQNLA